jgi:cobalt/nickel transport system ATP-binding protein
VTEAFFQLRGIHYAYDATPPILRGLDLQLVSGQRLGLVGPNGCGKTTLLHIMVGLQKPQAGEVHAFGRLRRTEADYREVRARAGLLFQDADDQLFCPTVAEDVAFGPLNLGKGRGEVREIVASTLAALGLEGFENRVTHKLSGGEKRLVSLAAVLAMQPDVLLLDEPTNALDSPTRERLIRTLQGLPQAMVIVSHDRDFRRALVTQTLEFEHGKLSPWVDNELPTLPMVGSS